MSSNTSYAFPGTSGDPSAINALVASNLAAGGIGTSYESVYDPTTGSITFVFASNLPPAAVTSVTQTLSNTSSVVTASNYVPPPAPVGVTVGDAAFFGSNITVLGAATLSNTLSVAKTLAALSNATVAGTLTAQSNFVVAGSLTAQSNATIMGTLSALSNTTLAATGVTTLTVSGTTALATTTAGATNLASLTVVGSTTATGSLSALSNVNVVGPVLLGSSNSAGAPVVQVQGAFNASVQSNLLLWAPFEYDVLDHSPNAFPVSILGTVGFSSTGQIGNCANFSNVGGGVPTNYLAYTGLPATMSNLSFSFWMRPTTNYGSNGTQYWCPFNLGTGTPGGGIAAAMVLYSAPPYSPVVFLSTGNTLVSASGCNVTLNAWQHLAVTYTSGAALTYINGAQVTSSTAVTGNLTGMGNATIGARLQDGTAEAYAGGLDDLRVYSRVLSPTEVASLYNLGVQGLGNGTSLTTIGALGVGTALPQYLLDVNGTTRAGPALQGPLPSLPTSAFWGASSAVTGSNQYMLMQGVAGDTYVNCGANNVLTLRVNNASVMCVGSNSIYPAVANAGGYTCGNAVSTWATLYSKNGSVQTSDSSLKHSEPLPYGLAELSKVSTVMFRWKEQDAMDADDPERYHKYYGLLADELDDLFPELVYTSPTGIKQINYAEVLPIVLAGVKELAGRLDAMADRVGRLESVPRNYGPKT
jgi:hypothetical protein